MTNPTTTDKPDLLSHQDKRILLLASLVVLACLASFGLGLVSYKAGVDDAQHHHEQLARIEAGESRDTGFWKLAGAGVFLLLGAVALVYFLRGLPAEESDDERALRKQEEAADEQERLAKRRTKLDQRLVALALQAHPPETAESTRAKVMAEFGQPSKA